jgi:hypothetical protein
VVTKVGCIAPWEAVELFMWLQESRGPQWALRGKGAEEALEVGPSELIVCLFTTEVTTPDTGKLASLHEAHPSH